MLNMTVSLNEIYDLMDKAIVYLSQNTWLDKWKIQKGIFYYLWLYSVQKGVKFNDIAKKIEIHPDRQGPFSLSIQGEVDSLVRDGFLDVINPEQKTMTVKSSKKGLSEFIGEITEEEEEYLQSIRYLVENLESDEVIFFIYYNPYIPDDIKEYFISKSEIKESLRRNKTKYIERLLSLKIIDNVTAKKIDNMVNRS